MCKWGTCVPMPLNGRVRDIDSCLALLIATLNTIPALETVACCCGHGKMPGRVTLKDGRELVIMSEEQAGRFFAVPERNAGANPAVEVSAGHASGERET